MENIPFANGNRLGVTEQGKIALLKLASQSEQGCATFPLNTQPEIIQSIVDILFRGGSGNIEIGSSMPLTLKLIENETLGKLVTVIASGQGPGGGPIAE